MPSAARRTVIPQWVAADRARQGTVLAPAPVSGDPQRLVFAGGTAHYYFFYPANHADLGIQPALVNEVMAHVEDDYALLEEWFGASYPAIDNIYVQIYDGVGGGGLQLLDDGFGGHILLVEIRDNDFRNPESLRTMILHETAHAFEWQLDIANGVDGSDDTGWFFSDTLGGTRSETLCRFLHSTFLAEMLGAAGTGWLGRNAYGVTQLWLNSARADYVNSTATSSNSPSAITGCGVLFLYYLRDQLGYTIPQIIAAGGLANTLQDIYETLTGDSGDPFPAFKGLLDGAYPSLVRSGIAGENPENPFPVGASILADTLPGTVLIVQAAWGADVSLNSSLWSWDDITRDVRQSDGATLTVTVGRTDEAGTTQPSQCTMLLDNRGGRYALGGQNPLYPYLRRNTPIRVSVSLDEGITWRTLFFGYADGWAPDWDQTGSDAVVRLSASGVMRRLLQGDPPSISPFRRYVEATTSALPVVYWPMEDADGATSFAAAIGDDGTGQFTMTAAVEHGPPKAAANTDFIASFPLPTVGGCELYGAVPWRPSTGELSLTMLIGFPDSGITHRQPLIFLDVSGSSDWWWIEYQTGGDLIVLCEDRYGTLKVEDAVAFGVDGVRGLLQLDLTQDGSDVDYTLSWIEQGAESLQSLSGTCTSRTLGRAQSVSLNTHIDDEDDGVAPPEIITPSSAELVLGHVTIRDSILAVSGTTTGVLSGHAGEGTGNRLTRVLSEAGETVGYYTPTYLPATPLATAVDVMGPQSIAPVLDLLREIEQVDGGILFDGVSQGLAYMPRSGRLSRPVGLVLDVADSHLLDPFHPDDDDRYTTNQVTVKRPAGSEVTAQDVDGPLGSDTIGLYDTSVDVNVRSDVGAAHHAAWRVHLGTVVGYRYPTVVFDLAKSPDLATTWAGRPIGTRIDVRNLLDARTQHPGGDLALVLEGYTQDIDQKRWTVTANCSLADPWQVVQVPPDAGQEDGPAHVDTSGSVLSQFTPAGADELRVTTVDGPDWSTDPADYPLVLDVGGMPVTVEACTLTAEVGGAAPVVVGNQLADDFDDNTIDTDVWTASSGTIAETGGVASVTAVAAGTGSWYESSPVYSLADSALTAKITAVPSLEGSTSAIARLSVYDPLGASGYNTYVTVYGLVSAGPAYTLGIIAKTSGQTAWDVSTAWSPTTYPWVRIREQSGQTLLEASADGESWLVVTRQTTPTAIRESTTLSIALEAQRDATASDGTPATFDNVSLTETTRQAQTFTVGGGVIVDDFADGVVNERLWPLSAGTYAEPGDGTIEVAAVADGSPAGLLAAGRYSLANTTWTALMSPPSAEDSATRARANLSWQVGTVNDNSIVAYLDSVANTFGWISYLGGVLQWSQAGSLGALTQLWLRVATTDTTVTLLHSIDGSVWTAAATQPLAAGWVATTLASPGLTADRSAASGDGTPAVFSNVRLEHASFDSMLTAKPAGDAVKLWRPPTLAL